MAVTLAQAALLTQNPLERSVIETFVQESPVLDRAPIKEIAGNAFAYDTEATLPGVAFRSVNESYTESTGTVNQATESLVILGGDADVDRFIVKTMGGGVADQRALQTRMKVKAASYKFQDTFFNGDVTVDPKGFDGLKKRLVGGQVLSAGTNGLGPVTAGHDFLDALDALIGSVPGINGQNGAIYANAAVHAKLVSSLRRLGGADFIREDVTNKRVLTYNGIPVLDPGQGLAGGDILPATETQGTATNASSIYAVKYGEDIGDRGVTVISNGGIQVDDLGQLQDKPAFRTRIEFYTGLAVFGGKAAARLTGVLAA